MKKILVPIDFSENSFSALEYAFQYASNRSADIDVLHFVSRQLETSEFQMNVGQLTTSKLEQARDEMKSYIEKVRNNIKLRPRAYNPQIHLYAKVDYPVRGILEFVKNKVYNLIICGNRGENIGVVDKIFGSVSTKLSQKAPLPVLYIPNDCKYKKTKELGYASNLNHNDPFELWRSLELLAPDNPDIRYFHIRHNVNELNQKQKEEMEKYLYDQELNQKLFFYDVLSDELENTLHSLSKNFNLDIFILAKEKENILERLVSKSTTASMLKKMDIPVMIMNP